MRFTLRRSSVRVVVLAVGSFGLAGCHGTAKRQATVVEPGLTTPVEGAAPVIEAPVTVTPAPSVSWVDRHPLFTKPRQYYDQTENNKVVKTAAATVIGVPAGVFGELKQIVTGTPTPPAAPY